MKDYFTRYRLLACLILILLVGFSVHAQSGPEITDITDQVIKEGEAFAEINLDEVVSDPDNDVDELTWVISDNNELLVSLNDHIAVIETPDENWFGEETLVFTVYDPDNNSSSDEAVFTVTAENDPPVISDIPGQIIDEGGLFAGFNLNDYVTDPDNDIASLSWQVQGGEHLLASIDATHDVTVNDDGTGWTGSENLVFTVSDDAGAEDSDDAVFTIRNLQDAPVAQNDSYTVGEGSNLSTPAPGVLSNDSDADGDILSAVLVSGPSQAGSFSLNSNGSFSYTHNGSETTSDQFTYMAYDGTTNSNTVTVTLTITPQNDAPVAVNDAYTVAEGGTLNVNPASGVLNNDTDAENNSLTAQKVTDPSNGTVTLNANGSFTYIHNGSETTSDQFTYRAYDGTLNSNIATVNITITPQNSPPVVSNIPNQTISEGATFATINLDGYVTDPDDPDNQISWTYSGNTQLTVSISPSRVATITIPNLDWFGVEIITFTATDPSLASASDQATFTVTNINDNPVLAGIEGSALTYNEGEAARQVTGTITVSDADNVITSAIIEISSNYQSDQDILAFSGGGLSASFNSTSGRLTLTGTASPTVYQNALRQVTYFNSSSNPSTATRTVRFTVNDGTASSNAQTRNISINTSNSAPILTDLGPSTISFTENGGGVQLTNTLTIVDDDHTALTSAQVSIASSLPEDQLGFTASGGISGSYSGGILSLSGTASLLNYRTVLRSVTYNNTSENPNTTNRSISITVSDGISPSNSIIKSVTITSVNDAPVLDGIETTALAYTEGSGPAQITNTLNVTDVENSSITSARINIITGYQNGQDVLAFTSGFGLTGSWNSSTGELLLTGTATPTQMRNALRTVTYENTSKNPSTTTRVIRFQVYDGENSNTVTRNISLSVANDAPVLADPLETPVNFTENGGSVRLTNTITVTDEDSPLLTSATVSFKSGFATGQDILTYSNASGITGSYNAVNGVLTFTGSASPSAYQGVLRNVRYDNSSEAPDITNRIISFVVNDGTTGSLPVDKTVTITPANDVPVASNLTITAPNNRVGTLHTANFTYTDPDGDDPGTHIYQWYRSAFASGASPTPIPGATTSTYRPVKADGGNYIGFEVTPVDKNGAAGIIVRIPAFSYINAAPVAGNVRIYAPQSIPGSTIRGRFNYSDKENNPRGNSIYRWYRSDIANPTPASPGTLISSASDSTYILRNTEAGKWVWFRVSPVATAGSTPGDSVWSNIIGPIGAYTASIAGSDTFCQGAVMPITLTVTGGQAPYDLTLTRSGTLPKDTVILNIPSSPRIINVKVPGTYTIKEVADEGGDKADITASTPVTLVVNPRSRARITGTTSLCQGVDTHGTLTLDFLTGTAPWKVTVRRGETSANDTIINALSDPWPLKSRIIGPGPTRHRVVAISDANNCPGDTTSGSAWLRYKTSPIAVISGSDSICSGETALLTVTLTSGNMPWGFTYQRNGVNAGTYANILNTSQTFNVSQQGAYTLSVVTDPSGAGCGSGKADIVWHTPPTAIISGSATICEHTPANLAVNLTGKSPWKFRYHRNFTMDSTLVENVLTSPRSVQVRKPGTYRLYEVIDRNGCIGTTSGSALITVTPAPVVTISGLKKAYNFKDNEIDTIVGTPAGGEYSGPGVLGNFFLPTIAGLGTHNIIYKYRTSPATCWGYDTAVVNVLESNAIILIENNRTKYCSNDAPFTVTGVNLEDNIGTFTISGGAGLVDHGDNTATIYPNRLNPNRYIITYSYYFGGDLFPKYAEFDVGPAPVSSFTWATECFHEGETIHFKNNSSSSFGFLSDSSYFWKITNLQNGNAYVFHNDSARDINYVFPTFGTYEIGLRLLNSYGCSDTSVRVFNLRETINLDERYYESFALHPISWQSNSATAINSWKLGNPSKHGIPPRGFSGAYKDTACWYTNITRIPAPAENSWVTSPCFDFSDSERPMLTMQIWRLFNSNRDGANIQFTADSGRTWELVGELGDGENWFNTSNIRGEPGGRDDGWSNYDGVSNDNNWVRARHGLDLLKGKKDVQFRIAYGSDGTPQNNDGIAFDDFTISERTKMTLIEHFTNTELTSSAKADSILDLFQNQYGVHALDVQYHTSNPSGDPFYEDNPLIPTSRQFYYGLSAVPYAMIDGGAINRHQVDYKAESKPFDRNVIIKQSLTDSKFQISVNASRNGNTLSSHVRLIANEPIPLMELSVRSVVVENLIKGISGSNGDTVFRNVVRTMLPDAAGNTVYKSWAMIEDLEIDNTWEIENVNDVNRLMVIAFIQNEATREIFNVAIDTVEMATSSVDPLLPPVNNGFTLYPNPARQQAMLLLNSRADNDIILQLFNNTGTLVYTARLHKGDLSAEIPVESLPDGLYMLRLHTGNKLLGIRKLIVTK